MKFKNGRVLVAISDMIALDFPWQKSIICLTGKHVSGTDSTIMTACILGSNFVCITCGKIPYTNKPLRTLKNIFKIDHEYD